MNRQDWIVQLGFEIPTSPFGFESNFTDSDHPDPLKVQLIHFLYIFHSSLQLTVFVVERFQKKKHKQLKKENNGNLNVTQLEVHFRNRSTGHHRSSFTTLRRSTGATYQRSLRRWRRCQWCYTDIASVPFDCGDTSGDTTYYQLSNNRRNYWSIQCICQGTSLWQCGEVDGKGGLHVIQVMYGGHFADGISRTFVCAWLWRQRLWDISCTGWLQFNKPIHAYNCHWEPCFTTLGSNVVVSAYAASCKRFRCSCGQHLAHVAWNIAGCCNCFYHGSLSLFSTDNASSYNQFSCTVVVLGLSWKSHPGVYAHVELILQEPISPCSALVDGVIKNMAVEGSNTWRKGGRWRFSILGISELSSFSIGTKDPVL